MFSWNTCSCSCIQGVVFHLLTAFSLSCKMSCMFIFSRALRLPAVGPRFFLILVKSLHGVEIYPQIRQCDCAVMQWPFRFKSLTTGLGFSHWWIKSASREESFSKFTTAFSSFDAGSQLQLWFSKLSIAGLGLVGHVNLLVLLSSPAETWQASEYSCLVGLVIFVGGSTSLSWQSTAQSAFYKGWVAAHLCILGCV